MSTSPPSAPEPLSITTGELVARNHLAARLLETWIMEPDDYDETVLPLLHRELESDRVKLKSLEKLYCPD